MKKIPLFLAVTAFGFAAALGTASAQTNINWSQTTGGNYTWTDTGNWVGANVPDSSTERAILNPSNPPVMSGNFVITGLNGLTLAGLGTNTADITAGATASFTVGTSSETVTITNSVSSNRALLSARNNAGNLTINANLVLDDANGVDFESGSFTSGANVFTINGNISGSSIIYKKLGRELYLGGNNTFSGGVTFEAGGQRGSLIATTTNAFINTSGTYTFATTSTHSSGIGSLAAGTTSLSNTIDLTNSNTAGSGQVSFLSGGTGTVFNVAGSIVNGTGATNIQISRAVNPNGTNPSGFGTVRFSGTNYSVSKNVAVANSSLEFSPASGVQTWSGNITGATDASMRVTKSGAGTTVLSGTNTYDAQTIVNGGTLLLNGLNQNNTAVTFSFGYQQIPGPTTNGHWQVESGGILGGTGRIAARTGNNANVNNAIAVFVSSGGTIAPGASIGTLTIDTRDMANPGSQRGLVMTSGAEFDFELAADGSAADVLSFWGYSAAESTLTLNNNVINLTLDGTVVAGTYERNIMTFFSDGGTTAVAHGFLSGLSLSYSDPSISSATIDWSGVANDGTAISIQYTVIPEPTTWALVAGSLTVLSIFRRRRA